MKPLAVFLTDRPTERAARLGPNHCRHGSQDPTLALSIRRPASQALAENDAKESIADSYAIPWRILKPNIYYKAHNFALGPVGSELSRHEPRPAGPDGDVAPPRRAAYADLSLDKPVARMVENGSCEG
jgi:hypothetical protein